MAEFRAYSRSSTVTPHHRMTRDQPGVDPSIGRTIAVFNALHLLTNNDFSLSDCRKWQFFYEQYLDSDGAQADGDGTSIPCKEGDSSLYASGSQPSFDHHQSQQLCHEREQTAWDYSDAAWEEFYPTYLIEQPEIRFFSQKQLMEEVKEIHADLVVIDSERIEVNDVQSPQSAIELHHAEWHILIDMNHTFLQSLYLELLMVFVRDEWSLYLGVYLWWVFDLFIISEYPKGMRPLCTTMPWAIWPPLIVLWGVCWMFIVPHGQGEPVTGSSRPLPDKQDQMRNIEGRYIHSYFPTFYSLLITFLDHWFDEIIDLLTPDLDESAWDSVLGFEDVLFPGTANISGQLDITGSAAESSQHQGGHHDPFTAIYDIQPHIIAGSSRGVQNEAPSDLGTSSHVGLSSSQKLGIRPGIQTHEPKNNETIGAPRYMRKTSISTSNSIYFFGLANVTDSAFRYITCSSVGMPPL